jgi:5'(3')-deoxyribonucleotidase
MKDFIDYFSEQKNPPPTIYCDMDGVLVDIVGGIGKLIGRPDLTNGNFDKIIDPLKKEIDAKYPNLFAELPWMNDGKKLWSYISRHKVEILSAHTTTWQPSSKKDKIKWIEKNLRPMPHFSNIVLRSQKKDHATSHNGFVRNILIDDWKKNIIEWESAGGIGIRHRSAEETIAELKKLGL